MSSIDYIEYYIPKKVMEIYEEMMDQYGKEFEEKNFLPDKTYRLSGKAYIDKKLEIRVFHSIPTEIYYLDKLLGMCSNVKGKHSTILQRKYDPEIDDKLKNYKIKTYYLSGYLSGRVWFVYDEKDNFIKDLTNYDEF